jgi:DNA-binding transcriptional regulator YiaG
MERLREEVKEARLRAGLTIEQAAEIADIEVHQWRYWEWRGKKLPTFFRDMCETVDLDPIETLRKFGFL